MFRVLGAGAAAAVASSLLIAGTASAAPRTVVGTVGPDFTISLSQGGQKVTTLKRGVAYRLVVNDRSPSHDFHLTGPGMNKILTSVGFTGMKSVVLTFKAGSYTFVCDPHSSVMHGSFKVS
jgi:plastocyanin